MENDNKMRQLEMLMAEMIREQRDMVKEQREMVREQHETNKRLQSLEETTNKRLVLVENAIVGMSEMMQKLFLEPTTRQAKTIELYGRQLESLEHRVENLEKKVA